MGSGNPREGDAIEDQARRLLYEPMETACVEFGRDFYLVLQSAYPEKSSTQF